ncbi:MAG: hypothetical protein ACYC0H_22195 [Solirubrobacteraceae bacterium]
MASTKPPNADAQALFDLARADLAWLLRDGYTETRAELDGAGFRLEYRSDRGAVLIGVHLGVSETVVMIGPPWITSLSEENVDLRRVLSARGMPVPNSRPPNRATRTQLLHYFRGYLEGLAELRQDELAGDWSKYDEAKDAASDAAWRRRRELEAGG